jgi:hypothetical protein
MRSPTAGYNGRFVTDPLPPGRHPDGALRFLQPEVKGARRSKLVGKGTVSLDGPSLVFEGKRMLPFWVQLLVVVGAMAASIVLLGIVAWPIAIAILFFGRLRHRESLAAESIRSVAYEPGRRRFLVTADAGGRFRCVGWQFQGDAGPLADALRRQFAAVFEERAVRGWQTY